MAMTAKGWKEDSQFKYIWYVNERQLTSLVKRADDHDEYELPNDEIHVSEVAAMIYPKNAEDTEVLVPVFWSQTKFAHKTNLRRIFIDLMTPKDGVRRMVQGKRLVQNWPWCNQSGPVQMSAGQWRNCVDLPRLAYEVGSEEEIVGEDRTVKKPRRR